MYMYNIVIKCLMKIKKARSVLKRVLFDGRIIEDIHFMLLLNVHIYIVRYTRIILYIMYFVYIIYVFSS